MLLPTHLVGGQVFFLGGCVVAGHAPSPGEALVALLASALPDLDKRSGLVGRVVPPLSAWLEYRFGHRTLTHSLLVQVLVATAGFLFLPLGYGLALSCGLVSHAFLDGLTPAGVAWLWPSPVRCVMPGNPKYRAESMGKGELGVLCVLVLLAFPLLRLAQAGQDLSGLIRSAIGDLAAARKVYDQEKGSFAFRLDVKGRDNKTLAVIAGEYPVIAGFQESGFRLDTPEGVKTLCRTSGCDWQAEHAVLIRGGPQQTRLWPLQAKHSSFQRLRDWFGHYAGMEAYLIGEARMAEALVARSMERPPVLLSTGERLRFDHVRLQDLEGLEGPLRELALSLQVRTPPGTAIPDPLPLTTTAPDEGLLNHWVAGRLGPDAEKPSPALR